MKTALITGAVMCCFSVNAAYIPVHHAYHSKHAGTLTNKEAMALLIAFNILSLLVVIIRSSIWLIKRPQYTYVEYTLYSNSKLTMPDFNAFWLVLINTIGGVIALSMWIASVL
jgi:hypothetical protein